MHHLPCEDNGFWLWLSELSESSAWARAEEQAADPQAGWTAIWIIPCTGDAECSVCVAHRGDIDENETFPALTARREPHWNCRLPTVARA